LPKRVFYPVIGAGQYNLLSVNVADAKK